MVCSSSTVPSGRTTRSCSGTSGSRVAATTGSTRRSSPGGSSCTGVVTLANTFRWVAARRAS